MALIPAAAECSTDSHKTIARMTDEFAVESELYNDMLISTLQEEQD